jgi:hypothetical protein
MSHKPTPRVIQEDPSKPARKKHARKPRSDKASADDGEAITAGSSPPSTLRGILPTPPEVTELLARELKDHPVTHQEKQRLTDSLKLQYYFGGYWIAYRHRDQGKEVLAVGMEEIGRLMRKRMAKAERDAIVLGCCDPW